HRTKHTLVYQAGPLCLLVLGSADGDFPSIRNGKLIVDELLPYTSLLVVLRLGMAQEQHVTQLDGLVQAIVLGKLIGVELRESVSKPLLNLLGKRLLLILPVDSQEFCEFVGTLDY